MSYLLRLQSRHGASHTYMYVGFWCLACILHLCFMLCVVSLLKMDGQMYLSCPELYVHGVCLCRESCL